LITFIDYGNYNCNVIFSWCVSCFNSHNTELGEMMRYNLQYNVLYLLNVEWSQTLNEERRQLKTFESLWKVFEIVEKTFNLKDSSPQGLSFRGPAPVEAIRRGDLGIGFETESFYSEVNADLCVYLPDKNSIWGFSPSETNRSQWVKNC
jgi:hypothetical protein